MTPRKLSHSSIAAIGALYPVTSRGLGADILAGNALGRHVSPVCTALSMATGPRVTDFVEVPEDAVRSQLEHMAQVRRPDAVKIGVLAQHGTAGGVLDWVAGLDIPVVLDLQISGPAAETVLSRRGMDEVLERLAVPDIILVDRTDAELVSGGEIRSMDDVQVAVQRIVRRGARSVLIKAGRLPARHFEVESGENGAPSEFAADLFHDGSEFALFEAPWIDEPSLKGVSSWHSMAIAHGLLGGLPVEDAVRDAKAFVTEALRDSVLAS